MGLAIRGCCLTQRSEGSGCIERFSSSVDCVQDNGIVGEFGGGGIEGGDNKFAAGIYGKDVWS